MNQFLNKSYITVIHNGLKHQLSKDSTCGFISCDEPLVRFQDTQHYYLVEKGLVWNFYRMDVKALGKSFQKKIFFCNKRR